MRPSILGFNGGNGKIILFVESSQRHNYDVYITDRWLVLPASSYLGEMDGTEGDLWVMYWVDWTTRWTEDPTPKAMHGFMNSVETIVTLLVDDGES